MLKKVKKLSFPVFMGIFASTAYAADNAPSCFLPSQIASPYSEQTISTEGHLIHTANGDKLVADNIPTVAQHATPFNAQESVVEIVAKTPDGYETGSGVIVNPSKSILTARHVVTYVTHENDGSTRIHDASKIAILDSKGNILGFAQPIANSEEVRDMTVLRITSFSRDGRKFLKDINGLNIAPIQENHQMSGTFSYPAGISQGASGAPAINFLGEIVGITVRATPNVQSHGRLKVMRMVHTGMLVSSGSGYTREDVKYPLPEHGTAYMEPIVDEKIVNALGVNVSVENRNRDISVSIPSYPYRHCVIYKGSIK